MSVGGARVAAYVGLPHGGFGLPSRTEISIHRDKGQESAITRPELDEALDPAARLAAAAGEGGVDLSDLGRRARRRLASTAAPPTGSE